ncbi:MAG: hypothetical protein ABSG63_03925 [Spirochaetia bacterium]|jgi:predicted transcriptional regulator of viral defense system
MKFQELVSLVKEEPVFTSGLLISGNIDPRQLRRQLSRWNEAGRIVQLRRGLYALAEPYRSSAPHPFILANSLVRASYVSLQSALAYYGMIPEHVPVITSVTTLRPWMWTTAFGTFAYRHISRGFFFSYRREEVSPGKIALLATPEKALCDLIHLTPGGDSPSYLRALRLQNLDQLDPAALLALVQRSGRPKLERARRILEELRDAGGRDAS